MIKKMRAALAMMLAGVVGGIGYATPASAVIGCPSGAICFYDSTFTSATPFFELDGADSQPNGCTTLAISLRNRATYIWNRSPFRWTVYTGSSCSATSGPIYANSSGSMAGVHYRTIDSLLRVG